MLIQKLPPSYRFIKQKFLLFNNCQGKSNTQQSKVDLMVERLSHPVNLQKFPQHEMVQQDSVSFFFSAL